ncbi:MAG: hypothetical protein ACE5Z5_01340 [Candidatus Bathyarchaeia archaeon]
MAEEIRNLQRELSRVRRYLARLEHRFLEVQMKLRGESEEERLSRLKEELWEEYPDMEFTPRTLRLLRLVGTLPYAPVSEDKRLISEAVAERYL